MHMWAYVPLFTPLFTLRVELIVGSNHYELPELIMALYAFHYMGVPYNKAHSSTGVATPWARAWKPHGRPCKGDVGIWLQPVSHDHQGFRPFSPDHIEAAGPAG